jgi:putative ABC transport system permease protein
VTGIIGWFLQVAVVTALNIRTMTQRVAPSVVAIVGVTGVVAVFVAVLSMAEGFRATMANTGSADTVMVMRSGADSEMTSILTRDAPGWRRQIEAGVVRRSCS